MVFCRFLKTYFSTILQFCGRSPVKSTKVRSLMFLLRIPYSTVSAMMLFKHDSFYTNIFIDDWSCYNIWKNENNSSQLLFDNRFWDWTKAALLHSTTLQWIMTNKKEGNICLVFQQDLPQNHAYLFSQKSRLPWLRLCKWDEIIQLVIFSNQTYILKVLLRLLLWLLRYHQNPFPDQVSYLKHSVPQVLQQVSLLPWWWPLQPGQALVLQFLSFLWPPWGTLGLGAL